MGVTSIPWPPRGEVSAIGTIDAGRDGSAIVTCSNNDEPAAGGPSDPPHYPRNEAVFLPAPENPQSVASGVHFGAQVEQLPPQQTAVAGENGPALPPSQTVLRLPTVVANMPAPIREPRTDVQPNPAQPAMPLRISESERERAERRRRLVARAGHVVGRPKGVGGERAHQRLGGGGGAADPGLRARRGRRLGRVGRHPGAAGRSQSPGPPTGREDYRQGTRPAADEDQFRLTPPARRVARGRPFGRTPSD